MKRLALIIALALLPLLASAQGEWRNRSRFRVGAEWGYSCTFYNYYHNNYIDETDGFRVDEEGNNKDLKVNAYATAMVGLDVSRRLNLALYGGYTGVYRNRQLYTMDLRASWFWRGVQERGWMNFIQGGVGFDEYFDDDPSISTKMGVGYRVALSRTADIDFILSYRTCIDHPEVYDNWEGKYVEKRNIRRNNALYHSVCFGIAISF